MSDAELLLLVESRKKSGIVAALLNLFLLGSGYIYLGKWITGIIIGLFLIFMVITELGWPMFGLLVFIFVDGFLEAKKYNNKVISDTIREINNRKYPGPGGEI